MEELEILVEENACLIYKIANMFRNSGSDMDDLRQAGKLGFVMAYKNYDPSYNVKFTTYAYPYIYGEISKFARENKGLKISRDLTKLYYKIDQVTLFMTQKLMREPTISELAQNISIDEQTLSAAILSRNIIHSIDEPVGSMGNDLTLHEVIPDTYVDWDMNMLLSKALEQLSLDEYELITNRYINDFTQTEIAVMLGTSQVQVSRKEQKVMKKLRTYMTN